MKRRLLSMSMVAAMRLVASSAFAAGVNLSWNNCFGEGTGASNKTFACASNVGTNILVSSFIPASDMTLVSGNELVIDLISQDSTLPAWWDMKNTGTCRPTSLGINFVANSNDLVCVDWTAGQAAGGVGSYDATLGSVNPSFAAQHRRIKLVLAVPLASLASLFANTEYWSCNMTVNNAKTVGTGACVGCAAPVCIVLNSLKITTNTPQGANDVTLSGPTTGSSDQVTWQSLGANCAAVPVKNATWSQVKSLYR